MTYDIDMAIGIYMQIHINRLCPIKGEAMESAWHFPWYIVNHMVAIKFWAED